MATSGKAQNQVAHVYETVIEDVINNVRESFLDDGVDEQVLQELKQIWESKLKQTKAVDSPALGDRTRAPVYGFLPQTKSGQSVMYQTLPAQTVQLSAASQQALMAVPDILHQQGSKFVRTSQNPIFSSYQPVTVLQQPGVQQVLPVGGSGQTIVLASTSRPGASQQQQRQSSGKSSSSSIIQVDGCADELSATVSKRPSASVPSILHCKNLRKSKTKKAKPIMILQVDGHGDSSSSDDDMDGEEEDDDDDDEEDDDGEEEPQEEEKVDEEPLNSEDDDSDQDAKELFDTDNVMVCQYDKIHRAKAKWKFNLKVGIMNLEGKDHVFQRANGEADW